MGNIFKLLTSFSFEELASLPKELREILLNYYDRVNRFAYGDVEFYPYLDDLTKKEVIIVRNAMVHSDNVELFSDFTKRYEFTIEDHTRMLIEAFVFNSERIIEYLSRDLLKVPFEDYQMERLIISAVLYDHKEIADALYDKYLEYYDALDPRFSTNLLYAAIYSRNFIYIEELMEYETIDFSFEKIKLPIEERRGKKKHRNYDAKTEEYLLDLLELIEPLPVDRLLDIASPSLVFAMLRRGITFTESHIVRYFYTNVFSDKDEVCRLLNEVLKAQQIKELVFFREICNGNKKFFEELDERETLSRSLNYSLVFAIMLDRVEIVEILMNRIGPFGFWTQLQIDPPSIEVLRLLLENSSKGNRITLLFRYLENFEYLNVILEYVQPEEVILTLCTPYNDDNSGREPIPTTRWRYIYRYVVKKLEREGKLYPKLLKLSFGDVYGYIYLLKRLLKSGKYSLKELRVFLWESSIKVGYIEKEEKSRERVISRGSLGFEEDEEREDEEREDEEREDEEREECKKEMFKVNLNFNLQLLGLSFDEMIDYIPELLEPYL